MDAVREEVVRGNQRKGRRRARTVSTNIKCKDNEFRPCSIMGSVRNRNVALLIRGGDAWALMTITQATRLSQWIMQAVEEAEARIL